MAIWQSTYDERPEDQGRFKSILENDVFAGGFRSLSAKLAKTVAGNASSDVADPRVKVYHTEIIDAPIADVWTIMRSLAGVGVWYADLIGDGVVLGREGRVGAQRTFKLDSAEQVTETLVAVSDYEHRLEYSVQHESSAFLNYEGTVELHPVTMDNTTVLIWTLDWPSAGVEPDTSPHISALKRASVVLRDRITPDLKSSA